MNGPEKGSSYVIGNILEHLPDVVKRAKQRNPAKTDPEVQNRVIQRIQEMLLRGSPAQEAETKLNAQTAVKKIQDKENIAEKAAEETRARKDTYSKEMVSPKDASQMGIPPHNGLDHLQIAMDYITDIPAWLHVDDIKNPAVAEYAARLAVLPPTLRDDPHVLFQETVRLYYSVPWTELSPDDFRETKLTIDEAMRQVHKHADGTPAAPDFKPADAEQFIKEVDSRPDYYRTKREEIRQPDPVKLEEAAKKLNRKGDKPEGEIIRDRNFSEWVELRKQSIRDEQLDSVLRDHQEQLDRAVDSSLRSRNSITQNLLKELESGIESTRNQKVYDPEYAVELPIGQRFDKAKAQPYIDRLRSDIDRNNEMVRRVERSVDQRINDEQSKTAPESTIVLDHQSAIYFQKNPILFLEMVARQLEKQIREAGYDDDLVHYQLTKFRLMATYFLGDRYQYAVKGEELDVDKLFSFDKSFTGEDRAALLQARNTYQNMRGDIFKQYHDRLQGAAVNHFLSKSSDFAKDNKLIQALDGWGDSGLLANRTYYGALSSHMLDRIREIHHGILRDPATAGKRRSSATVMEEVIRKASDELYAERAVYNGQYRESNADLVKKAGKTMDPKEASDLGKTLDEILPGHELLEELTPDVCETITRLAATSYTLEYLESEEIVRGAAPAEDVLLAIGQGGRVSDDQFETAGAGDKMAWCFAARDAFIRKWTNLDDGEKATFNKSALFYVRNDPELEAYAQEKTRDLWQRLKDKRHEWRHLEHIWAEAQNHMDEEHDDKHMQDLHEAMDKLKKDQTYVELRVIFSEYENHVEDIAHATHTMNSDINWAKFLSDLDINKLYHYTAVDIGGEWVQANWSKPYGIYGSGVRRNQIMKALDRHDVFKQKGIRDTYCLSFGVIDAAGAYFHADHSQRTVVQKMNFMGAVDKAMRYDPHQFFRIYHDVNKIGLGAGEARLFTEVERRSQMINTRLKNLGLARIDYSKVHIDTATGAVTSLWTEDDFKKISVDVNDPQRKFMQDQVAAQMKVLQDVFDAVKPGQALEGAEAYTLDMNGYLAKMRSYYDFEEFKTSPFQHREGGHRYSMKTKSLEFTHMKYMSAFRFILYTKDVPLEYLESPTMMEMMHEGDADEMRTRREEFKKEMGEYTPLSRQMVEYGDGRNGLMRRAWADFFGPQLEAFNVRKEMLKTDWKPFLENTAKFMQLVPLYQGFAVADNGTIDALAGIFGITRPKAGYGALLSFFEGATEAKDYVSSEIEANTIEKIEDKIGELNKLSNRRLNRIVPERFKNLERFLDLSHWGEFSWVTRPIGFVAQLPGMKHVGLGEMRAAHITAQMDQAARVVNKSIETAVNFPIRGINWTLDHTVNALLKTNAHLGLYNINKTIHLLDRVFPSGLWGFRGRNAMLFLLIIISLQAANEMQKGGKEGSH